MQYLKVFRHKQARHLFQSLRTMSSFNVKSVEGDDRLQLSFEYPPNGEKSRIFNASRPKVEEISSTLTRIGANISKHVNKKRKKKTKDEEQTEEGIQLSVYKNGNLEKIEDTAAAEAALQHGNTLMIGDQKYTVDLNPPCCLGISIPQSIMVGFPIFPKLDVEFTDLRDCQYMWKKIKYDEQSSSDAVSSRKKNSKDAEMLSIADSQELCSDLGCTPTNDEIGYRLSFTCVPRCGDREGRPLTVESKFDVTAGPGFCPFENRHQYTQKHTDPGEFRVVSYNILADLYADQDYSRDVLYSYCPPYALSLDYRKHLIIKELQGYHGDILCLQEVDHKVFHGDLSTALEALGYAGFLLEKDGEVREGSAIYYRQAKFRLLDEYREILRDVLENYSECQDIVKKVYKQPDLKEKMQTRSTCLHVVALESVDCPGQVLLVANTHLYFHPDAGHIRMIQVLVAMRYINILLQKYKHQSPCLVFCGDFNSTCERGIYEFMTTKHVHADNIDWMNGGPDQFIPEMNFSHTLNLDSGCGKLPYTNYTSGFHGHLDYIYYDTDQLEVTQVIPPPDHRDVELHTALPSIVFPSDHIAQICDLKWRNNAAKS